MDSNEINYVCGLKYLLTKRPVLHPALTEVNNKFSGDCNGAGCGFRCVIQSLSDQLAFLLVLMVARSGPQTAEEMQSLWSGACWTQKPTQRLAFP